MHCASLNDNNAIKFNLKFSIMTFSSMCFHDFNISTNVNVNIKSQTTKQIVNVQIQIKHNVHHYDKNLQLSDKLNQIKLNLNLSCDRASDKMKKTMTFFFQVINNMLRSNNHFINSIQK